MHHRTITLLVIALLTGFAAASDDVVREQFALEAFQSRDYALAARQFKDDYRSGVAHYRAGQYQRSAAAFERVSRPTAMLDAQYNLGNAYVQMGRYVDATQAYQQVLTAEPEHKDAQFNLALVQQLLAQQTKKQPEKQEKKQNDKKEEKKEKEEKAGTDKKEKNAQKQQQGDQKRDKGEQQKPDDTGESGDAQQGKSPGKAQEQTSDGKGADESAQADEEGSDKIEQTGQDDSNAEDAGKSDAGKAELNSDADNVEDKPSESTRGEQAAQEQGIGQKQTQKNAGDAVKDPDKLRIGENMRQQGRRSEHADVDADDAHKGPGEELSEQRVEQWLRRVDGEPSRILRYQFFQEEQRWRNNAVTSGAIIERRPW